MNEIMWHKKKNEDVKVVAIEKRNNKNYALVYITSIATNQNGNGWFWVCMKDLIPYPQAEAYKPGGMSKTYKNKIKSHLNLSYAEWTCTDGSTYTDIEEAIQHQEKLLKEKGDI